MLKVPSKEQYRDYSIDDRRERIKQIEQYNRIAELRYLEKLKQQEAKLNTIIAIKALLKKPNAEYIVKWNMILNKAMDRMRDAVDRKMEDYAVLDTIESIQNVDATDSFLNIEEHSSVLDTWLDLETKVMYNHSLNFKDLSNYDRDLDILDQMQMEELEKQLDIDPKNKLEPLEINSDLSLEESLEKSKKIDQQQEQDAQNKSNEEQEIKDTEQEKNLKEYEKEQEKHDPKLETRGQEQEKGTETSIQDRILRYEVNIEATRTVEKTVSTAQSGPNIFDRFASMQIDGPADQIHAKMKDYNPREMPSADIEIQR